MSRDVSDTIYIKDFRQLKVWQKSVKLAEKVYAIVDRFPDYERYAMTSQLIRCSTSIGANLCEGNSQIYKKKELNFGSQALGSAGEAKHWVIMAHKRKYIDDATYNELTTDIDEVIKMIIGYMKKVRSEM